MIEVSATVRNAHGIHCRPSAVIIKAVADYAGTIAVVSDRGHADLRSVISLMALALLPGDAVIIRVIGPSEEEVARQLVRLFETHFDFPPRAGGAPPPLPPAPA